MTKKRFITLCQECSVTVIGYSGNHRAFFVDGTEENLTLLSQYYDEAWAFDVQLNVA